MITQPSIYTPKDHYECDGSTFEFPITFEYDRPQDVAAFITLADGTAKWLVPNQDFVVRTNDRYLVTRVDDYRDPYPVGVELTILLRMPFVQPSGRTNMSPQTFASRIDSLTKMCRQMREQLDRTLHVGQNYPPFYATSQPYAPLFIDSALVGSEPSKGYYGVTLAEELLVGSEPTGGLLAVNFVEYLLWPTEEVDVESQPVSGTLDTVLLSYDNYDPEEVDVESQPTGGTRADALLSYDNYEPEEVDVSSEPTGGTLS